MLRAFDGDQRKSARFEFGIVRTTGVPQRSTIGNSGEGEDFLHAAIAVRRDHYDVSAEVINGGWHSQDDVVVELTLLPVIDELIASPLPAHLLEQGAKHEAS